SRFVDRAAGRDLIAVLSFVFVGNARGASRTWAQLRVAALLLLSVCLLALLAGCGSSSSGAAAGDPANIAPANSLGYVEVTVRPEGSQHPNLIGIVHRFSSIDPDALIQKALNKALSKRGLDYAKDVRPWLGQ